MKRNYTLLFLLHNRKIWLFIFFSFLMPVYSSSQTKGVSWNVSSGINIPVGVFAETHLPGAGVQIQYSNFRFGALSAKFKNCFSWLINSGVDYYFGKKEKISSYPFRYTGYFVFHSYAGILYNSGKNSSLNLTAGPGLSIYKNNTRFNIGSAFFVNYYTTKRLGIGSGLMLLKEAGADALWSVSIRGNWAF